MKQPGAAALFMAASVALLLQFPSPVSSEESGPPAAAALQNTAAGEEAPPATESIMTEEAVVATPLKSVEIDGKMYHFYGIDVEIKKRMHDVYETEDGGIVYVDRETGTIAGKDSKYHRGIAG